MKFEQVELGRVFVLRLEDGEILHETVERFAAEQGVRAGFVLVTGGADSGSRLVVGPQKARAVPVLTLLHELREPHEIAGVGTLFPDEKGVVTLHLHLAAGRGNRAVTGCVRLGVKVWHIMEAIVVELRGSGAIRRLAPELGFKLLDPEPK